MFTRRQTIWHPQNEDFLWLFCQTHASWHQILNHLFSGVFSSCAHTHPVPLCTSDQGDLVFVPKICVCFFQVWKSKEAN